MWVRSPTWDGLWLLSGLPLGVALTVLGHPAEIVLVAILATQTGHLLAPLVLAWSHAGFRRGMARHRIRYVGVPLAILIGSAMIGWNATHLGTQIRFDPVNIALAATSAAAYHSPFMTLVILYGLWNGYHFGKQNFGVLSIYRYKTGGCRRRDLIFACGVTWVTMAVPIIPHAAWGLHNLIGWPAAAHPFLDDLRYALGAAGILATAAMLWHERSLPRMIFIVTLGMAPLAAFWVGLWAFAIISLNHWLASIGLASHVHGNSRRCSPWPFALGLMTGGVALFCLLFVDFGSLARTGLSEAALHFTLAAVGFRLGLGFVHFLYEFWLYRLSDPIVRATIGRSLFDEHRIDPVAEAYA